MTPLDTGFVGDLASASGQRLISESLGFAVAILIAIAWGIREYLGRKNSHERENLLIVAHGKEMEYRENIRLDLKKELLEEKTAHQRTRDTAAQAQLETLRVAHSVKDSLDAFLRLQGRLPQ